MASDYQEDDRWLVKDHAKTDRCQKMNHQLPIMPDIQMFYSGGWVIFLSQNSEIIWNYLCDRTLAEVGADNESRKYLFECL